MKVNVLTYNIHHGVGMDKTLDLKRITNVLKASNADIICLNEVDKQYSGRSEFMDQPEWIAKELDMAYVFGPAITLSGNNKDETRQYGNAILTKLPILKVENHPFDFLPRIIEDRALLEVLLSLEGQEVAVYAAHLSLAPFLHGKQTGFILERVMKQKGPAIIMGDWNMKPYTSSWKSVTNHLKDTWIERHGDEDRGYTYPSRKPRMKLDYIFTDGSFDVLETKVLTEYNEASDHLPLFARLKLNDSIGK